MVGCRLSAVPEHQRAEQGFCRNRRARVRHPGDFRCRARPPSVRRIRAVSRARRDNLSGRRAGLARRGPRAGSAGDNRRVLRRPDSRDHRRAVVAHRRRAEPGPVARRRHAGLAPRRAGPGARPDHQPEAGQPASARRGKAAGRVSRRPLWHPPYRSRYARRMAARARPHEFCARRAHPRRIRRRSSAGFGLGAGRAAGAGD